MLLWRSNQLRGLVLSSAGLLGIAGAGLLGAGDAGEPAGIRSTEANASEVSSRSISLKAGEIVEISARIAQPSALPPNARLRVRWELVKAVNPDVAPHAAKEQSAGARTIDAFGIYSPPTANWSKLLHALDPDTFVIYRAPVDGEYRLSCEREEGAVDLFEQSRWREAGKAPENAAVPKAVRWPAGANVDVTLAVNRVDYGSHATQFIEAEPNDTPEQAQFIPLPDTLESVTLHVLGGADDIEYFDNGDVGRSGDDWFRLDYRGSEPRLLSVCLSIPDQMLAARTRVYELPLDKANAAPGQLLPIDKEYETGKNENERVHQQEEQHRIAINRTLQPGHAYFLRVEANAPGYDMELRIVKPAPFDDPRQAVQHALYDHLGQVQSWLANRPRGASVERRIRDTGNLLGTACMSCHTQSGVWGPAIPFAMGYRAQNVQLYRDLTNICYQSMRPTNELIDAANNTSLAPLDLGDGPAGTRVAGHAVVSLERFRAPRKLQSKQAIRAANFVLQSGDPGGINAAGPGANVGRGVVYNYAGEIVWSAWQATGDPKYFRALEDKARKTLEVDPKFTDDMCHRIELLKRWFPADYVAAAAEVAQREQDRPDETNRVPYQASRTTPEHARDLRSKIENQIAQDLRRLRDIQNEEGSWGFNPGSSKDGGKTWQVEGPNPAEPSPTALALIAFEAAGFGPDDPSVAKGVKALLNMQHPTGYWKRESQTGFVSTSYSLHALSRLYPVEPPKIDPSRFAARPGESVVETVARVRAITVAEDSSLTPLLVEASTHDSALVRYWAMIGLGAVPSDPGVEPLIRGLGDRTKLVREAARWALRQNLIDDRGWPETMKALGSKSDYVRESAMQALVMRVDGVMPGISVGWGDLSAALARGMNEDAHPAVRAWATRAAWNWWIWNPPLRQDINFAWLDMFERDEPNALVENCIRYQSQALFIANGHKANGSTEHQYKELADLFLDLRGSLRDAAQGDPEREARLAKRLVGVAATFYNTSGGDGGPGQMGYRTPNSGALFGDAVLSYFKHVAHEEITKQDPTWLQIALEGSANIPHSDLQQKLIDYSLNGPEDLRPIAAASISDPRSAQLVAVPELIEPLMQQVHRGANEPNRRKQLSDPVLTLFGRVKWIVPQLVEQQREILTYMVPKFSEFKSAEELKGLPSSAARAELEKRLEAEWYLASGLGDAIGANPDLHLRTAFEFVPVDFGNALVARFWLPSVEWILTYDTMLPEVRVEPGQAPPADPHEELRSRMLSFFVGQLKETAEPRNRELAVKLAQATALRRNPEVLTGLAELLQFEKREPVVKMAQNVLKTGRENFVRELESAVARENPRRVEVGRSGRLVLTTEFVDDFTYFRDYVSPEMNRVLRGDQRSCFACHGIPGRVPPLELKRPDDAGYLSVADLLVNYRLLQERVDLADVEKSKLLRKPLNVQTGQEDGHQGGRRYQPMDPGYLILRKWALNQAALPGKLGHPSAGKAQAARKDD